MLPADPLLLTVTRIGGISSGVLIMLFLSLVILPKSATLEAVGNVSSALKTLVALNTLTWKKYLPSKEGEDSAKAKPTREGYEPLGDTAPTTEDERAVYEERCEKALTDVYQLLFKFQVRYTIAIYIGLLCVAELQQTSKSRLQAHRSASRERQSSYMLFVSHRRT